MPLALLLQKLTAGLAAAAKVLTPWLEIVSLESTIVERGRSAFLVHWFGTNLPFEGLSLRARIVNMSALDAQFRVAQRSVSNSQGGPNLTSPVLGFAGMLGGMLLSPVGAATGASLLLRFSEFSVTTLLKAIAWILAPFALGAAFVLAPTATGILLGGGLAAAGFGFATAAALGDRQEIRGVFDLFGALARFMNAGARILDQLTGRTPVENPLLRSILAVAGRGAAMFAQLLGALAVLIQRIAPVLPAVVEMAMNMKATAVAVVDAIGEVVDEMGLTFDQLRTGRLAIGPLLKRLVAHTQSRVRLIISAIMIEIDVLSAAFTALSTALSARLDTFLDGVVAHLKGLFWAHPVGRIIDAFRAEIAIVVAAFSAPPPPGTPPKTTTPNPLQPLLDALPALPPVRDFPDLPGLPDRAVLRRRLRPARLAPATLGAVIARADELSNSSGPDAPIELGRPALEAIRRLGQRPSILEPERATAEATFGGPLDKALELNQRSLLEIRGALSLVFGRILPPALRATLAPRAAEIFGKVDRFVYAVAPRSTAELPVVTPSTAEDVRPVVTTLRLRVPGATVGSARRFQEMLTVRLAAQFAVQPQAG